MERTLPKERLGDLLNLSTRVIDSRITKNIYQTSMTGEVLLSSVHGEPIIDEILHADNNPLDPPPLDHGFTVGESFAGAGGMSLGFEMAGFKTKFLVEYDKHAVATLRKNRPHWNVIHQDISTVDFKPYHGQLDVMAGGFPCQPFSTTGKELGFDDTRGTLFHEFARSILETQPKAFVAENVAGLISHDKGRTLKTICQAFSDIGYTLIQPRILKAMLYQVPQKRERLFLVGYRNDIADSINFSWPQPSAFPIYTTRDALCKGNLYSSNVPESEGARYPKEKQKIMHLVPEGGNWRNLPLKIQKSYMGGAFDSPGGKTSFAKRLSWDSPSNTLTCSPSQKQTDRCHPQEDRPLTTREYARIQTFPDNWQFCGGTSNIYKQIGNAVPVNLSFNIAKSLIQTITL
jgi:DNA (cytosine-5)-methyltransferase 1